MKKALFIFICIIALAIPTNQAKANYAAGGELIYVHIADSTYQFFFKLYRDCSGSAEPDTIPLCFFNPCTNQSFTVQMPKWTGTLPPPIGTGCANVKTTCDSPGSLITGYKEYWYVAIATMPLRCNAWRIFVRPGNRNKNYNFVNSQSSTLYVETTMNNALTHNNSSPFYSARHITAVAQNLPFYSNNGAIDADGDSLWTDLIIPRTGPNNCSDTPGILNFDTASPPYNLNTNPFRTGNTFFLHGSVGQFAFTPKDTGKASMVVRTREYRNGVLIGSVMREMQVQTVPHTYVPVFDTISHNDQSWPPGQYIYGCMGSQVSHTFSIEAIDTNRKLYVFDNSSSTIPGISLIYNNQGTDSVRVTFTWTPTSSQAGKHSVIITIVDSTCQMPGILLQYARTLDFWIWDTVKAFKDTSICPGQVAFLSASGGAQYQWTVLSGSQNSLSNPNAANPVATPTITTTYIVTSTINPYCTNINKDTVTVTVRPSTPGANAIATSFGCGHNPLVNYINACPGQNISFCFNTQSTDDDALLYPSDNSATSLPNAIINYTGHGTDAISGTFTWTPGPNDIGFHSVTLTTYDSACVTGNSSHTKQQTVGIIVWGPPKIAGDTFICHGESVQLTASGGLGYHWRILRGGSLNSLSDTSIYNPVATPDSNTTYVVTSLANTYCSNNKDSITVQVYPAALMPKPRVSILVAPDTNIHLNNPVTFTAYASGCNNIKYQWFVNGTQVPGAYNSSYTTSNILNLDKLWCKVVCADTCPSPADTASNIITMHVSTSVGKVATGNGVKVYPNPNSGKFVVEYTGINKAVTLSIINLMGQKVYTNNNYLAGEDIHLTGLSQGTYIIRAMNDDRSYTGTVIIK